MKEERSVRERECESLHGEVVPRREEVKWSEGESTHACFTLPQVNSSKSRVPKL